MLHLDKLGILDVPQEAAPMHSKLPCLPAPSGIWPMGVTGRKSGRRMQGVEASISGLPAAWLL